MGEFLGGSEGDHGGVVGGEIFGGEFELEAGLLGALGEGGAEAGVAGDAAGDGDEGFAGVLGGGDGFGDEDVDDGFLEGGGEVVEVGLGIGDFFKGVEHGSFEAAEGEGEVF